MEFDEAWHWIGSGRRRQKILLSLRQPLTAKQLSRGTRMPLEACMAVLWELRTYKLVFCLNPGARRHRLYWLTSLGKTCRQTLQGGTIEPDDPVETDWAVYGWACNSHRKAIIKTLDEPLQPSAIKRKALLQDPDLRMSANNVRDALKPLLWAGVITKVEVPGKAHARYALTELGERLQDLLFKATG